MSFKNPLSHREQVKMCPMFSPRASRSSSLKVVLLLLVVVVVVVEGTLQVTSVTSPSYFMGYLSYLT